MRRRFAITLLALAVSAIDPSAAVAGDRDGATTAAALATQGYRAGVNGDYPTAIVLLTRSIVSGTLADTALAGAYVNRGVARLHLGLWTEAVDDFSAALRLVPDSPLGLRNRGLALAKLARFEEALADLDRVIVSDPGDAKALLIRGNAYFDQQMFAQAISDYGRALAIAPDLREAKANRHDAEERLRHSDTPCDCATAPGRTAAD